jgi:hypothetical protein
MVASGWKLVLDILRALEKSGLNDATTHIQLQKDEALRSRYLVLCDIVSVLVDLGQTHFSVLAMTTRMPSHTALDAHILTLTQPTTPVTSKM